MEFSKFDFEKDLQRQRELFRLCFPEAIGTPALTDQHYAWKFHTSKVGTESSYEYAAWDNDTMVGYYAAIPYPYLVNGSRVEVGMVCDVMTHPAYRGKGIFKGLGKFALNDLEERGVPILTGYPVRPEVIPGHLSIGWHIARELPVAMRILRFNTLCAQKGVSVISPLLNMFARAFNGFINNAASRWTDYSAKTVVFDDDFDFDTYLNFFSAWSAGRNCYLIKDKQFLSWRLGAPDSQYQFSFLMNGNDVVACAITRVVDLKGVKSLSLLDLMFLSEHEAGLGVLFCELSRQADHVGAELIGGMFSNEVLSACSIMRTGFVRTPIKFKLILREFGASAQDFSLAKYMSTSDYGWLDSDDL